MTLRVLLLLAVVLLSTLGQIGAKRGAVKVVTGAGWGKMILSAFNLPLILGSLAVFGAPLLYFKALQGSSLLFAYSFTVLGYPLVLISSRFLLNERLTLWHWGGIILISGGVFCWTL